MNNCIFCKIAKGEIPSAVIEETETFRAILDVAPATKGHVLILPKVHYENIYDLPEEMAAEAIHMAKRISLRMKETLKCDGVNLVQNNEKAAGQTVFHFHLHVIPRYDEDGQSIGWKTGELTRETAEEIKSSLEPR